MLSWPSSTPSLLIPCAVFFYLLNFILFMLPAVFPSSPALSVLAVGFVAAAGCLEEEPSFGDFYKFGWEWVL